MKEETILLKDLQDLLSNKGKFKKFDQKGHIGIPSHYGDGMQGEYNETFVFYSHPGLPVGTFMKETYHTNSYGEESSLVKIEFVKGKEKQITVYEPI